MDPRKRLLKQIKLEPDIPQTTPYYPPRFVPMATTGAAATGVTAGSSSAAAPGNPAILYVNASAREVLQNLANPWHQEPAQRHHSRHGLRPWSSPGSCSIAPGVGPSHQGS